MLSNAERARVAALEARLALYQRWVSAERDNKPQPLATWAEVAFLLALVQRLAGAEQAKVYIVIEGSCEGGISIGAYESREFADAAMAAWVEARSAKEVENAERWAKNEPDFPRETEFYQPDKDVDGGLMFRRSYCETVSVEAVLLNAPCRYPFQDALDAAHERDAQRLAGAADGQGE